MQGVTRIQVTLMDAPQHYFNTARKYCQVKENENILGEFVKQNYVYTAERYSCLLNVLK